MIKTGTDNALAILQTGLKFFFPSSCFSWTLPSTYPALFHELCPKQCHSPSYIYPCNPASSSHPYSPSVSSLGFFSWEAVAGVLPIMGTRLVPRETAALLGAFVALLAVSFGAVAAPAPLVVGSIKCLDCSPDDVKAEDAFRGMWLIFLLVILVFVTAMQILA